MILGPMWVSHLKLASFWWPNPTWYKQKISWQTAEEIHLRDCSPVVPQYSPMGVSLRVPWSSGESLVWGMGLSFGECPKGENHGTHKSPIRSHEPHPENTTASAVPRHQKGGLRHFWGSCFKGHWSVARSQQALACFGLMEYYPPHSL